MSKKLKWNSPGTYRKSEYSGLYGSWCDMHRRAGNKGGKWPTYTDVTVCERWNSYDNFFKDMSSTWWKGALLDKDIIKPGNRVYCPEYCKWVSKKESNKELCSRINSGGENSIWYNRKHTEESKLKMSLAHKGQRVEGKRVKCIETNEIFESCKDAETHYKLTTGSVNRSANPKSAQKTSGGYHWEYV